MQIYTIRLNSEMNFQLKLRTRLYYEQRFDVKQFNLAGDTFFHLAAAMGKGIPWQPQEIDLCALRSCDVFIQRV